MNWLRNLSLALALVLIVAQAATAAEAPQGFIVHEAPQPIPGVQFTDDTGGALSLSDFQGKVVLLNIWATWCGPCRKEMPKLDRLQATLGGSGFEVVALSIDRGGIEKIRNFFAEIGVEHLKIYVDTSGKAATEFGIYGLPGTLLLDREGREVGRLMGPAEWDSPEMVSFLKTAITQSGKISPSAQQKETTP